MATSKKTADKKSSHQMPSPANPKARRTHPTSNNPGCAEAHWTGESDVHDATRRGTDRVAVEPRPVRSVPRCGH